MHFKILDGIPPTRGDASYSMPRFTKETLTKLTLVLDITIAAYFVAAVIIRKVLLGGADNHERIRCNS